MPAEYSDVCNQNKFIAGRKYQDLIYKNDIKLGKQQPT